MTHECTRSERLTTWEQLEQTARQHPDLPAVSDLKRPDLTFAELRDLHQALRALVARAGIRSGEAVAIAIENRADAAVWITALSATCRCLPIAPSMTPQVISLAFKTIGVRAVISDRPDAGTCGEGLAETDAVVLTARRDGPWHWALKGNVGPAAADHHLSGPVDVAFYLTTSGSTGLPKIVPIRHQAVAIATDRAAAGLEIAPGETTLNVMQLNHVHGLVSGVYLPWSAGACSIMPGEYGAAEFISWFATAKPTWVSTSPAIYADVLRRAGQMGTDLRQPNLRFMRCGSAALNDQLRDDILTAFGVPLLEAYGMSEALIISGVPVHDPRQGTVGRPVADEVAIFDEVGRRCGPDATGEIRVRGRTIMSGYLGDASGSEAFDGDWFKTGDIGRMDRDGFLYVQGRIGDRINMGGETVAPAEIEAAFHRIEGVRTCLCFGLPHPVLGESLAVVVIAKDGATLEVERLRMAAADHLPRAKVPTSIFLADGLPLDANGKINRRQVAAQYSAAVAQGEVAARLGGDDLDRWVLGLFRQVLRRDDLSPTDHFFDRGGTSLDATETMLRVEETLGVIVHLPLLFDAPTAHAFAATLRNRYADAVARAFPSAHVAPSGKPASDGAALRLQVRGRAISPRAEDRSHVSPLVILSAPRSGSTLLRTALAGHPGFFAPPELRLLGFETIDAWAQAHDGKFRFFRDGLVQAVISAMGCDEETARAGIEEAVAHRLPVERVYDHLQHHVGNRRIVEKSPLTALSPSALAALETRFQAPRYVVLHRNPLEVIRSYVDAGLDQVWMGDRVEDPRALAEAIWTECQTNIRDFVRTVDPRRVLTVHFEDLVIDPEEWLTRICKFARLPFDPAMLDLHDNAETRMSKGLGGSGRAIGDPKLWHHRGIDPARAGSGWSLPADARITPDARSLAAALGYGRPEGLAATPAIVRAQQSIVQGWSAAGEGELLHTIGGRRDAPPLIWCCQTLDEAQALAAALEAQTAPLPFSLSAMRSGDLLASRFDRAVEDLAEAYAVRICTLWPTGPIRLAGNCQGADVAKAVAARLCDRGRDVPLLLAVDPDFHGPLAIPVAHVFGETSHRNPFLRGDAGVSADWDRMYPRHSMDFLPCGHGQYFSGPVLSALVDILIRRLNLA